MYCTTYLRHIDHGHEIPAHDHAQDGPNWMGGLVPMCRTAGIDDMQDRRGWVQLETMSRIYY